jgi:hypothetical protein
MYADFTLFYHSFIISFFCLFHLSKKGPVTATQTYSPQSLNFSATTHSLSFFSHSFTYLFSLTQLLISFLLLCYTRNCQKGARRRIFFRPQPRPIRHHPRILSQQSARSPENDFFAISLQRIGVFWHRFR